MTMVNMTQLPDMTNLIGQRSGSYDERVHDDFWTVREDDVPAWLTVVGSKP